MAENNFPPEPSLPVSRPYGAGEHTPVIYEGIGLREAARFLSRHFRLILGITLAGGILGLLTAYNMTPQYRAETIVMKDLGQTKAAEIDDVVSGLSGEHSLALHSEMDIISSRAIIDRVIDKLNLLNDPEFVSHKVSLLTRLHLKAPDTTPDPARERTSVAQMVANKLKVSNDEHSFSIWISYESSDAQKAALIANTFADEYLVDQLEVKYESAMRVNKWLDERLGILKKQVEEAEKAVGDYREKAKIIEVDDGSTITTQQMESINTQLIEARASTSQAEARLRSVRSLLNSPDGIDGAADVLNSPIIQHLREQETEVRRKEAEMATKYGELHPKMIDVRAEYEGVQKKIKEEIQRVLQSLTTEVQIARAKQGELQGELQKLEGRAQVETSESVALRQLQREADASRSLYENFLTRFKQTGEEQALRIPDSRIIARAEAPLSASFPSKFIFLLAGLTLGAIVSLLTAYLTEYFNPGFRSASQLEQEADLPVIGIIPRIRDNQGKTPEEYILNKPFSAYAEVLRTIRTSVHFSNVDSPPKTLMVTSAMPGEGKTSFSLSLARSLAKAGNRILLIDADMRRPRIASALGLSNIENSLALLLAGDKTLMQVVYEDPLMSNLSIIPTLNEANAQDLLTSHRMQKILQEAKHHYDLTIIDTPPVLAVSDASIMGRVVDSTVMLVRWGSTPRESVIRAIKQLKSLGGRIAGIALTQVNLDEHAKYGEGHLQHAYNEYYTN